MKFLKVQADDGTVHNISAYMVINFKEIDEVNTQLWLEYPYHKVTFEVPKNADDLIEEIYGTDDTADKYEIIDCTPTRPEPGVESVA